MSLLNALRERLLGQAAMMRPGQGFGGATQGLLGQGGRFGGGLMQTRMDQPGGLLGGQIPELALLGSALYGQGIQGKDPFEGLFPAYTQAAQLKKALTPEKERLIEAYDPEKGETVFATRTQIEERGLTPVPSTPEYKPTKKVFDIDLGKNVLRTEAQIAANPDNFEPAKPEPKKRTFGDEILAVYDKVQGQLSKGVSFDDAMKSLNQNEKNIYQNKIEGNPDVLDKLIKERMESMDEAIVLESMPDENKLIQGQKYKIGDKIYRWNGKEMIPSN